MRVKVVDAIQQATAQLESEVLLVSQNKRLSVYLFTRRK